MAIILKKRTQQKCAAYRERVLEVEFIVVDATELGTP